MTSPATIPKIGTALVTGGAGFIGSHLVDGLLKEGIHVRIIDNLSTGKREQVAAAAEFIEADIRNADSFRDAFAGVDCVFHVAALARVPLSIERPVETHQVNVLGTLNVLVAARDAGVRRFIFSGSSSVYGEQPTLPLHEEMILEGAYPTVIGAFLHARRNHHPLTVCGDGEQSRDFTFVSDVARANLLAARCSVADGRAINIGRGCGVSVNRIAALIGGETVHVAERAGEPRRTLADLGRAESILGWRPQVSIEQGLAELMRTDSALPPLHAASSD
jgi:UDP-glucose 4-epimerase